jgi:PPOX class probable F420-dependent enzyme
VIPFVFVLVEHGDDRVAYWAVDHKPKRSTDLQRIRNLQANPAVEFVVDGYGEDWDRLWWVRCSGIARVVDDHVERSDALRALGASTRSTPWIRPTVRSSRYRTRGWELSRQPSTTS